MTRDSGFRIAIEIEDPRWRDVEGLRAQVRKAATIALQTPVVISGERRATPRGKGTQIAEHRDGSGTRSRSSSNTPKLNPLGPLPLAPLRGARPGMTSLGGEQSITFLLTNDARLHALNKAFRRKNKATNVLSFPAAPNADGYLGDVAIAFGVARGEARAARKPFQNHVLHLVVHGVLHLLGYDHETARDAKVMEPLEIALLHSLGIPDPYRRGQNVA